MKYSIAIFQIEGVAGFFRLENVSEIKSFS